MHDVRELVLEKIRRCEKHQKTGLNKTGKEENTMAEYPFTSLRDWIEFLEDKDLLAHNHAEVDLYGDVAAISRRICETRSKAVVHHNIKGYPGWKIFSDGLTTRERQAMALGMPEEGLVPAMEKKQLSFKTGQ